MIAGSYSLVTLDGKTGELQWRVENDHRVWSAVAVADLTGDGSLEIVITRSGDELTVYDTSGNKIWKRNPFSDGELRTLALASGTVKKPGPQSTSNTFWPGSSPAAFKAL
jgi:outer membrane protein assembly factor BamB